MLEGTKQNIIIASSPVGAQCDIVNNGDVIASVAETPGTVTIDKNKNDIYVECSKAGYQKSRKKNFSDMAITSLGNMAFMQLSFVGNAIDSATGANHKYDSTVFVTLAKDVTKEVESAQIAPQDPPLAVAMPVAAPPQATGQTIPAHASFIAEQLVQALNDQQPSAGGSALIPSQRAQELAGQLAQEVAQLPPQPSFPNALP